MKLLAFDTSTSRLSIGVQNGARRWLHEDQGGAQSSATLIANILKLLEQASLKLSEVDAVVFGRGPGSFTGLRTACAVAQGLGFGANRPVLPIDGLQAVAECARLTHGSQQVLAMLDARMDQIYVAPWVHVDGTWQTAGDTVVLAPEAVALPPQAGDAWVLAGNARNEYGHRFPAPLSTLPWVDALPTAAAMLSLAPAALAAGDALPADQALPVYVRDKVAKTTIERRAEHPA